MNLTLIGYGKMGKTIHDLAKQHHGYNINKIEDENVLGDGKVLQGTICIDFTNATAFGRQYETIAKKCSAAVVGTTGWEEIRQEVYDCFKDYGKTLIHANNFSIGANIYFEIVDRASKLLAQVNSYDPYILEMHHCEKKDQPSGTAKELINILQSAFNKITSPVSVRCGWIRGVHEIGYESKDDKIVIKHEAYSRNGFAAGALLAAEWSSTVKGVWSFRELLVQKLASCHCEE